jgi:2-polyprenyl-6-methoxyphenol hydroxylase-like FAD-dependent oxidoreductase
VAHVVIVGAGPAGAALGYLLARRGVRVSQLERQTDFAREFRGEVLMPSGIDAIRQMGLGEALDELPHSELSRVAVYRNGRQVLDFAVPGSVDIRAISQPAMLEMFAREASALDSFKLLRGVRATDLLREGGRVVGVSLDRDGTREPLFADYVFGADGRASLARKRAGLDEERSPQAFDVVWFRVPRPTGFAADHAHFFLGRGHVAIAFPSWDGRLQIAWLIRKGEFGALRARPLEDWVGDMAAHVTPELGAHLRTHVAEVTHPFLLDVVCDRLVHWSVPGLLLIGDAAHPAFPVPASADHVLGRRPVAARAAAAAQDIARSPRVEPACCVRASRRAFPHGGRDRRAARHARRAGRLGLRSGGDRPWT